MFEFVQEPACQNTMMQNPGLLHSKPSWLRTPIAIELQRVVHPALCMCKARQSIICRLQAAVGYSPAPIVVAISYLLLVVLLMLKDPVQ